MTAGSLKENGITPAVNTYFSGLTVRNVIDAVCRIKADAVFRWLDGTGVEMNDVLIIGTYLTGAHLACRLAERSQVTVLDIYPHLKHLLNPGVRFVSGFPDLPPRKWDVIVDTSGLGGVSPGMLRTLPAPEILLVEDPCSDASDEIIKRTSQCGKILSRMSAIRKGILVTGGLQSKTSGTMTLTMDILRRSMCDALQEEGVLYSTAAMESYERVLFQERDMKEFQRRLDRPALTVSSLVDADCDTIIRRNLSGLSSRVRNYGEGEESESIGAV